MLLNNSKEINDFDSIDEDSIEILNIASKKWQREADNP